MNEVLERRFAEMGARLSLTEPGADQSPRIDIRSDGQGEYFDVRATDAEVVALDARDRHLLLLVRDGGEKSKFLCGHDERHWFVAAVPEDARGVTSVATAKAALQPRVVHTALRSVRRKNRFRRRNEAFVRQGEWFFVPAPGLQPAEFEIRPNEPLSRGAGSKPHVVQFLWRTGGTRVYVNQRHPTGISEARWQRLSPTQRASGGWFPMVRDPVVYAKGTVRHPDHATIELRQWHRVVMNTENRARAMQHVAFLD